MKILPILTVGSVSLLISLHAPAATIYATTDFGNLISFDSSTPGTLTSTVPITGLAGNFEGVNGIDFRPADGRLYAWGNAPGSIYRLYTINLVTGVATRVPGNTDLNLTGTHWGFDFNPTVDRIRVVSDTNVSIRLNPNDGTLTGTDISLNPSSAVSAAAYDRNDTNPSTLTTLLGIDSTANTLVRIGGVDGSPSPNLGAVTTIGPLGVDPLGSNGFDIGIDGVGYAAFGTGTPVPARLYTINLSTGAATLVGQIGDGTAGVRNLAVVVPEPSHALLAVLAGLALRLKRRRR